MKKIEDIKKIIKLHKKELENKYKVNKIAIFGSFVRDEQIERSDIDILVDLEEPIGLLFVHLSNYLEVILETKIDLITKDAIKPNRLRYIMKDLIYI
jgi:uncharacterized protein